MKNIFVSVKFLLMEKIHMELIFMHSLYYEVKVLATQVWHVTQIFF